MKRRSSPADLVGAAALILSLLLAVGCGDDSHTGPVDETPTQIQMPLAVGNRWVYDVTDSTSFSDYTRTDSISGTATFGGRPYYRMVSIGAEPDTTYLRQEGQKMYLWLPWSAESPEDSVGARLRGILQESLPWTVADFATPRGAEWRLAQVVDTLQVDGMQIRIEVDVRASSLGRSPVTVPSGTYVDVYGMRLRFSVRTDILGGPPHFREETRTMEGYIRDGVGIVRQREVEVVEETDQATRTATSTSLLRRFDLMR